MSPLCHLSDYKAPPYPKKFFSQFFDITDYHLDIIYLDYSNSNMRKHGSLKEVLEMFTKDEKNTMLMRKISQC
jgi:hypothetical protein